MEWLAWAIPLGIGGIAAIYGYGRLWQRVENNKDARLECQEARLKAEGRLFKKLDEVAEGVNKIKGRLGINND